METVLVLFRLAVKSSYAQNVEFDASGEEFDTVQFYYGGLDCWRIKTFAVDQDVHVWNIGKVEHVIATARANTEKHYGDVIAEGYIFKSQSGLDGLRLELAERGLDAHLEVAKAGFAFWTPIGTTYRSKSLPAGA